MTLSPSDSITRRRLLQGAAAIAAASATSTLLAADALAADANPQPPIPSEAPTVAANFAVTAAFNGRIPANFVGLSPGKNTFCATANGAPFSAGNKTMTRLLRLLAPNGGTLRIGQGAEDTIVWNKNGKGDSGRKIDPVDIKILVDFLKASGWSVLYGLNLGGMAPAGNDPPLVGTLTPTSPAGAAEEVDCLITTMMTVLGRAMVNGKENWLNHLAGIEIGNEPDLDGWHEGHAYCTDSPKGVDSQGRKLTSKRCGSTIGEWTESGKPAPWGFEETWEEIRTAVLAVGKKYGVTLPMTGPGATNIYTEPSATQPGINNPASWTREFGRHKASEVSMLTFHFYPSPKTVFDLLTPNTELYGPWAKPTAAVPASGILGMLYEASADTAPTPHRYGLTECNTRGAGGLSGVSNTYASALWAIDFLFAAAQGYVNGLPSGGHGASCVCINVGDRYSVELDSKLEIGTKPQHGGNYYSPIYYKGGTVDGVMPIFYGMMFVGTHCGQGDLYSTGPLTHANGAQPVDLNVTTYALHQPGTGSLKLIVVNKDFTGKNHLQMTATLPEQYKYATLIVLTQGPGGSTVPDIGAFPATAGASAQVAIQGATVHSGGGYTPGRPYTLEPNGAKVSFNVPALSAVMVHLSNTPV
jgi:hypothetical protein